jgi:hypothetical protein
MVMPELQEPVMKVMATEFLDAVRTEMESLGSVLPQNIQESWDRMITGQGF